MQLGVGYVRFPVKKHNEGVRCHVISVTRGWVGVTFTGKYYVTHKWPPCEIFKMAVIPGSM